MKGIVSSVVAALAALVVLPMTASASLTPTATGTVMNYAFGDYQQYFFVNDCPVEISFSATGNLDGSNTSGSVTMTSLSGTNHCSGKASGVITCLTISGNNATVSGLETSASGIFKVGNVILGTVTDNDGNGLADSADFVLGSGSATCPPPISGPGPTVLQGGVEVYQG